MSYCTSYAYVPLGTSITLAEWHMCAYDCQRHVTPDTHLRCICLLAVLLALVAAKGACCAAILPNTVLACAVNASACRSATLTIGSVSAADRVTPVRPRGVAGAHSTALRAQSASPSAQSGPSCMKTCSRDEPWTRGERCGLLAACSAPLLPAGRVAR
jgi:hypothetical protein